MNLLCDFQSAHLWHLDIENGDLRLKFLYGIQCRFAISCFRENGELLLRFDCVAQTISEEWMIVGDDERYVIRRLQFLSSTK